MNNDSEPLLRSAADLPEHERIVQTMASALLEDAAELVTTVAADLEQAGELATYARDRQSMFACAAMLRIESRARGMRAEAFFRERAARLLGAPDRSLNKAQALALIDEEFIDAQLLAGELAKRIRVAGGAAYQRYSQHVATLLQGHYVDDEVNPLGARVLAASVVHAFANAADLGSVRTALRQSLLIHGPVFVSTLIERVDRMIDSKAIAPSTHQVTPAAAVAETVSSGASAEASAEPPGASSAAHTSAPVDDRSGDIVEQNAEAAETLGVNPILDAQAAPRPKILPTLQPVVDVERDAVAFAHSVGVHPYSREARRAFFNNVRQRLIAAESAPTQLAVVDVVAAMFDYVVDDRRLPQAAQPLVWRIQQPAVALALLDAGYLGEEPRSLRRLIENFGAITTAFGDEVVKGNELYRRLDTVVRAIEIVASALQTRSAVMSRQIEIEYGRAAKGVSQLIERVVNERQSLESTPGRRNRRDYRKRPGREVEVEVSDNLRALLTERLAQHQVPESVREFVLNVWLRQLRTTALRDGQDSAQFTLALQVVDDLLWSLDSGKARQSRRELAQRIPPLIRLLTQGLAEMGAKDEEFKPFFDELFLVHLRKMQSRRDTDRPAAPDVPVLEEKVADQAVTGRKATNEKATDEKAADATANDAQVADGRGSGGHLPDPQEGSRNPAPAPATPAAQPADDGPEKRLLEVLNSLDLNDFPADPVPLGLEAQAALDNLSRGRWVELIGRDNEPGYAKVAWINSRRTVALLVRRPDRRALSLRFDELRTRFERKRAFLLA